MKDQSIFDTTLTPESNTIILSAAKWSRFIGISFLIISGFMVLLIASLALKGEEVMDQIKVALKSNPQLADFQNLPVIAIIVMAIIILAFIIFFAMLYVNIGKHGIDYFSSNEEDAFIKTFRAGKTLFLVMTVITILQVVVSLVSRLGTMA